MKRTKVGIIGCGNISQVYLDKCQAFDVLEVAACADLIPERAAAAAEQHGIARALPIGDMLADKSIEIILNLTIPAAHREVALSVLEAGKHVYNEKPLANTFPEAQEVLAAAQARNLRVGCAPDTFLGAGIQTCRKLIDDGWIGRPVAATAFMMCHGHESWHPDPAFYYKAGGGPMFDMGPYYLTALVNLIGPVGRVCGSTKATFPTRTITSEAKFGTVVEVETATHIAGTLDFANGAIGTIVTSFDVWGHHLPCLEIHGTEGSISVPDPNCFGGPVKLRRFHAPDWENVPLSHAYAEQWRGIGIADMASAIQTGRPHRANGAMALHVVEVMSAFDKASESGCYVDIATPCEQPAPMPMGLREGLVD